MTHYNKVKTMNPLSQNFSKPVFFEPASVVKSATIYLFYFILLFITLLHFSALSAKEVELDHIIVVVNNSVITQQMLNNRVRDFKKQLSLSGLSDNDSHALRKQVLEKMIITRIQLQKAKQHGIQINDLMLNRVLGRLAKSNHLTLEQFRDAIEKKGLSYDRFRKQTRDELIIKNLQQRLVANKITVSNQDIQQYIKQNKSHDASNTRYHLRHILINIPEEASPKDIQKAEEISKMVYKKILAGSSFRDMAIKYSQGRNAIKGGDLGVRKANELPRLFVHAVQDLSPGQTAKPVRSASGFHILQLVSRSNQKIIVKQTHARHILIRTGKHMSDEQARQKLLDIRQQIKKGAKFSAMAEKYSEDPGSKNNGGDLGWAGPGDFVPAFERVMNKLKPGQISEPFKSPFGWHLLQVLGRRNHDQTKLNKENMARQTIERRKTDEQLGLWLRRIRDEAYVKFLDKNYQPSNQPNAS